MPKPTPQDIYFSFVIVLGQLALLHWAVRHGLWRLWLALCTLLALSALGGLISLVLLAVDYGTGQTSTLIPILYFYSYWYGALLIAGLQGWMIWEIAGRITGCGRSMWFRGGFLLTAAAAIAAALLISLHVPAPLFLHPVTRVVAAVDRTIWLTWCLLFVVLTASADLVGLKWRRQVMGITSGFVVQAVAGTLYSWLITASNTAALDAVANCASLLSLCIWALAFREAPFLILTPEVRTAFEATLRQFETIEKE